jgi:hypothetical protein
MVGEQRGEKENSSFSVTPWGIRPTHVAAVAETMGGGRQQSSGDNLGDSCGRYQAPACWVIGAGVCTAWLGLGGLGLLPRSIGPVECGAGLHCSTWPAWLTSFHLIKSFINTSIDQTSKKQNIVFPISKNF